MSAKGRAKRRGARGSQCDRTLAGPWQAEPSPWRCERAVKALGRCLWVARAATVATVVFSGSIQGAAALPSTYVETWRGGR